MDVDVASSYADVYTIPLFNLDNAAPIPLVSSSATQETVEEVQFDRDGRSLLAHKFPMEAVARRGNNGNRNSHTGYSSRRTAGGESKPYKRNGQIIIENYPSV